MASSWGEKLHSRKQPGAKVLCVIDSKVNGRFLGFWLGKNEGEGNDRVGGTTMASAISRGAITPRCLGLLGEKGGKDQSNAETDD